MSKLTFILMLAITISNTLVAQQLHSEKNASADSSKSKVGFIQKSSSSIVAGESSSTKNSGAVSIGDQKAAPDKNMIKPVKAEESAITAEIMKVDYPNMPADVQSKINDNKYRGKNLLEGVTKIFTIEIKSCLTDADHKKTLLFLKSKKGFVNSQFVSAGFVKIIVDPTFDASYLKDVMTAEGIHFNFLKRSYLLKK